MDGKRRMEPSSGSGVHLDRESTNASKIDKTAAFSAWLILG
jgi:hypothetical protein